MLNNLVHIKKLTKMRKRIIEYFSSLPLFKESRGLVPDFFQSEVQSEGQVPLIGSKISLKLLGPLQELHHTSVTELLQ